MNLINNAQNMPNLSVFNQSGLIDLQFANFGQSAVLEFCDEQGQSLGHLICHDVLIFHYIDAQFKQGIYADSIQGFSHYIHQIQCVQKQQHWHLSLRPYVNLDIECKEVEVILAKD